MKLFTLPARRTKKRKTNGCKHLNATVTFTYDMEWSHVFADNGEGDSEHIVSEQVPTNQHGNVSIYCPDCDVTLRYNRYYLPKWLVHRLEKSNIGY